MNFVIKRFVIFVATAFLLVGCGAADDRVTISADGEALTRAEMIEILEVGAALPFEGTSLNAADVRSLANEHVDNVAFANYFETKGIVLGDEQRAGFAAQVNERAASINAEFGDSPGFDFWVDFLWRQQVPFDAYYDGDVPGVFQSPPFLDNVDQLLAVPEVLAIPAVMEQPSVLENPSFQELLLTDPTIGPLIQTAEFNRRRSEIVNEFVDDVDVESRLGRWDPDSALVVSH